MKDFCALSATALGLLLLLNGPAFAGTAYKVVTENQDGFHDTVVKGRLLVDGEKYRIERETGDDDHLFLSRVEISKDGGKHRFALDLESRTFYELETNEATASSPLFQLIPAGIPGERIVENVKVESREGASPETMAGSAVRRREITVSYDVTIELARPEPPPGMPRLKGPLETVRGTVKADAVFWMAEDKAPLPVAFAPEIRTGFPEVDGKLAEALASLRGLALKQQVTVSAEGGSGLAARSSTATTTIEGPRPFNTQAALFEVPSGFRRHKPELIMPGFGTSPMPVPGAQGPP